MKRIRKDVTTCELVKRTVPEDLSAVQQTVWLKGGHVKWMEVRPAHGALRD